jgi:hypothetical protein
VKRQSNEGFIARVELGPNHAFDLFEHDNGTVSYAQLGGPGVRPLKMEGFDNLSPRDVFEVLSPGKKLPGALEKYPRTNAPRTALSAELTQHALLTNQHRSGPASPGTPCPWEFFRDTSTVLGPMCIPGGTNYEVSNCWQGAGFVDWHQNQNDNALGAACATHLSTSFFVTVNSLGQLFLIGPGYWVQWKTTGSCHREWWPPGSICDAPFVQFKIWNPVSPRLHFAYDVTGNGKTLIRGGWGMYVHQRGIDELQMGNALADSVVTYTWHDNNGNKLFDPGEVNFNPNGPDFVARRVEVGQALSGAVPNPNEKEPMTDEFSMSFERELIPNFAVRATGIYSREHNAYRVQNNKRPYNVYNIPVTARDPGPDGRLGTSDDPGTTVTYWEYPVAYQGAAFQEPMLINDKGSNGNYRSFEVAATKRMSNRWMMMASYSATKLHVPFVSNTAGLTDFTGGGGLTVILATFDPNAEINSKMDLREWQGRLDGAYILPHDMLVSANFEHRSGAPYARTVSFTGGTQIPSQVVRVEPIGTRRLPNINLLHMRFEKSLRMARGQKVGLRVNVFNVTNINTEQSVTQLSGANFLRPAGVIPPRIVEFGVNYTF